MDIWEQVIKAAKESLKSNDIPIGALILKDGVIIAEGYNTREKNNNILGHAEVNAILSASNILNNWNLQGCDLYVTLKPCSMCMEIIKQSRISNVYYLLEKPNNKKEYNKTNVIKIDSNNQEIAYCKILNDFFVKLRENKD